MCHRLQWSVNLRAHGLRLQGDQHLKTFLDSVTSFHHTYSLLTWLGSRVVSVLDLGAEGPWFKSQSRRSRVKVLGKLFTPIVLLFTKQQNW